MITRILKKSNLINYIILVILLSIQFFIYQYSIYKFYFSETILLEKLAILLIIFASIFFIDFITKRSKLNKDNSFLIFFYFLFLLFFPDVLNNYNLIISNFFVIIAFKFLVDMYNSKILKQKIFDASLCIFIASLFHFWAILFFILVLSSIFLNLNKDYRNWFIPIIGLFAVAIFFVFFSSIVDKSLVFNFLNSIYYDFKIEYFKNTYQNLMFSIFVTMSLFFVCSFILTFSHKSKILIVFYQKIFVWFVTAISVYLFSGNKSNATLIFAFAPLSIIAAYFFKPQQKDWQKEVVFISVFLFGLIGFICQL